MIDLLSVLATLSATVVALVARCRRVEEDNRACRVLVEHWEPLATAAQQSRDHLAERLKQTNRDAAKILANTTAERDKVIVRLLAEVHHAEHEGQAAVAVAMARVTSLTAQLSEHEVKGSDEDTVAAELRELIETEAGG